MDDQTIGYIFIFGLLLGTVFGTILGTWIGNKIKKRFIK